MLMLDPQFVLFNSPLLYSLVALSSLIIGSLLNVIIYRLPIILTNELLSECQYLLNSTSTPPSKLSLFWPRSFCPACQKSIKAIHNIPILSYCLLHGRCNYCKNPISKRYPLVEGLSCLLSALASWHFGFNVTLIFALLFIWILIALFCIDLDYQLLPDSLTLTLLWLGLIANTQSLFSPLPDAVLSAAGAYLALWLFTKIYYLITGKIGMGHGDFKLFAAFGAYFGWHNLPIILLLASSIGAIIGIIYLKLAHKPHETPIPFGPFLCVAGFIALFGGNSLMPYSFPVFP